MQKRKTACLTTLILSLVLFFSENRFAEPVQVTENLRGDTVLLPSSTPDKGRLILVSFVKVVAETDIVAALALYDDPRTKRSVDYLEVYDPFGGLLLISWVDRFGIHRIAMDHGLLEGEASKLERVLVLLPVGAPS